MADKRKKRRKDRVLNTRIPEDLDRELREQAERLDMPVSQLVRNILTRTVDLVGNLSGNVEHLVHNVVDDVASFRTVAVPASMLTPSTGELDLESEIKDAVLGWQELTLTKPTRCILTGVTMDAGTSAHLGIRADGRPGFIVSQAALDRLLAEEETAQAWVPLRLQKEVVCAKTGKKIGDRRDGVFSAGRRTDGVHRRGSVR